MVDRRRWPTAAYFHNWPPRFYGDHILSINRKNIPEETEKVAYEQELNRNPGQLLSVGERVRELYWSALQFENSDEYCWHFDRILGFGAFGLAASYEKRNENGQLLDRVVAKSESARRDLAVNSRRIDTSKEAYHLAQLNERSSGRTIGLRGYKYLTGDTSVNSGNAFTSHPGESFPPPLYQEWRSFLELCELGNLYGLILKYKAWGYHLPEAFIWWTFLQLMQACDSMDTDSVHPFRHEGPDVFGHPRDNAFMLHNDMKEENIFVKLQPQSAEYGLPYSIYPLIQLADFGLSHVTAIGAPGNRADMIRPGTEMYLPPEKRKLETRSSFYPFTEYLGWDILRDPDGVPLDKRQHPIGPEANVWGVGAIIYLLMTLRDGEQLSRIVDQKLDYSDPNKPFPGGDMETLDWAHFGSGAGTDRSWDYSDILKKAVMMCTRLQPSRRPAAGAMVHHLKHYMDAEAQRLRNEFKGDEQAIIENTRLNITHDDWNQTPAGPFLQDFCVSLTPLVARPAEAEWLDYFWSEFWKYCDQFAHPNDARLIPPTASQPIDVGPNYQNQDYLGDSRNFGQEDDIVYYPWQYHCQPHSYHSRTFFPPGGRAVRSRPASEQQMAQQPEAAMQQHAPTLATVPQMAASEADIDDITAQVTARQSPAQYIPAAQRRQQELVAQAQQQQQQGQQFMTAQQMHHFAAAQQPQTRPWEQQAPWTPAELQQRQQLLELMQQQQQQPLQYHQLTPQQQAQLQAPQRHGHVQGGASGFHFDANRQEM